MSCQNILKLTFRSEDHQRKETTTEDIKKQDITYKLMYLIEDSM